MSAAHDGTPAADRSDEGAWWSPAVGAHLDGHVQLVGRVPDGTVGLLLRRPGHAAEHIPVGSVGFDHRVVLGGGDRGSVLLELWIVGSDGERRLWQRRPVTLAGPRRGGLALGVGLAWTAAQKALRALRDGRLSAHPRDWLYLLRRHVAESKEVADAERRHQLRPSRAPVALRDGERVVVPSSTQPRVSVIIVIYNRPELVLAALRSLPGDDALEVILVDNGSGHETARLLDRIDGAVIVRNADNRGFLLAVNQAAAIARGEVLLLLNSDAELRPHALAAGLAALGPGVGAVGGKLIHPDGRLQEAGASLQPDGSAVAVGRGAQADDAAYDFRRDCDYVSGALLLTPRRSFLGLDSSDDIHGFDEAFAPAYYEDADYCVRLWKRGLRVVYEPDFAADHLEFGSAASPSAALLAQAERRPRFLAKHASWLRSKRPHSTGTRVLFVDDRLPYRLHGAGHPRAGSIVRALVALGCAVTVYPTLFPDDAVDSVDSLDSVDAVDSVDSLDSGNPLDAAARRRELPSSVERVVGRGSAGLRAFLSERAFDVIVVSRAHNLRLVGAQPVIIYDAEALTASRDRRLAELTGAPTPPADAAQRELDVASAAKLVLAVSDADAAQFRQAGLTTRTLGHALVPRPTPRPFADRSGMLFVGAFAGLGSPNADAVQWLATAIWPKIRAALGPVWLIVAGARLPPELLVLDGKDGIELRGAVSNDELGRLYDEARIFVAPLRAAAGLPYKIHEAAAHGLPVVTTELLAGQLGWRDELAIAHPDSDGSDFAAKVIALYRDPVAWAAQRAAALARVTSDCDPKRFESTLAAALAEVQRG